MYFTWYSVTKRDTESKISLVQALLSRYCMTFELFELKRSHLQELKGHEISHMKEKTLGSRLVKQIESPPHLPNPLPLCLELFPCLATVSHVGQERAVRRFGRRGNLR